MGNGSLEINLEIVCHTLPLTTKIQRVVNIRESGHYELSPKLCTEPSQKGHGCRLQGLLGSVSDW